MNAADQACKENVREIARQRKLDTAFTLVKKCAEYLQSGIRIDCCLNRFALLRDCEGVTIVSRQEKVTQPQPAPVSPASEPVRGLWDASRWASSRPRPVVFRPGQGLGTVGVA